MSTTLFDNKQQYLSFKQVWGLASRKNHLTAEHHLFYNLVRGFPPERGFSNITNSTKLDNGAYINHGLYFANVQLKYLQKLARMYLDKVKRWSDSILFDFVDRIDPDNRQKVIELLKRVEIPDIVPINKWSRAYVQQVNTPVDLHLPNAEDTTYQQLSCA